MELFTFDQKFKKEYTIDVFNSAIWTSRYYGDSDVELVVPLTMDMIDRLKVGKFLGQVGEDEPLIIETMSIENNLLKVTGISILSWLNNRFVRHSNKHEDRYWYISNQPAGQVLWTIIKEMCTWQSSFIQGWYDFGIAHAHQLGINGLTVGRYDTSGGNVNVGIPYGPLYDALRELATTYEIGMRITLTRQSDVLGDDDYPVTDFDTGASHPSPVPPPLDYILEFTSYRGNDRSSVQSTFPLVRFSAQTDSLMNAKEVQSAVDYKNIVYAFAPSNPGGLATSIPCGRASVYHQWENTVIYEPIPWSFDIRALMIFADDITTDQVGTSSANLKAVLDSRAADALTSNPFIVAVDGEISPEADFKYGTHYGLGDIIEVQGNSGAIQRARVTEFIKVHDSEGERAYPTVTMFTN